MKFVSTIKILLAANGEPEEPIRTEKSVIFLPESDW